MINRQNTKQKHKGHLIKHEHVNKEVENQKSSSANSASTPKYLAGLPEDLNSEKDSLLSSCIHPLPSREDLIQPQLGEMEGK